MSYRAVLAMQCQVVSTGMARDTPNGMAELGAALATTLEEEIFGSLSVQQKQQQNVYSTQTTH